MIKSLVANWNDTKKTFRLINRVSYTHSNFPFRVDISVVKMGIKNKRGGMIPVYKIEDSNVFSGDEVYEIELELDNELIASYYNRPTPEGLEKSMKKMIKIIMSGLQNSNYPITYPEQKSVIEEYLAIIHGEKHDIKYASPKYFCGPSSYTLELKNIQPTNLDLNVPNIRNNYTVTDKADGIRKLLFINSKGKVYLITMLMKVEFTGVLIKDEKMFNTILDGEHILHNKHGGFINLFAAFDIYYFNKKSVREKAFAPLTEEEAPNNFRISLLIKFVKSIKLESVTNSDVSLRIENKRFFTAGVGGTIFDGCNTILKKSTIICLSIKQMV